MRFLALANVASTFAAARYEADAAQRHIARQAFIGEEIDALPNIKRILIAAEELIHIKQ